MSTSLNWELREHQHRFRDDPGDGREIRFDTLINLILHANQRGRTWVSRDTIAKEIGAGEGKVSAALKWLFDRGATYNVPHKYRVGVERDLEPRKYVFQLTGIIRFSDGLVVPYLFLNDPTSTIAATLREIAEIGGQELVDFLTKGSGTELSLFGQGSDSDRSESDRSNTDHKGFTDLKGNTDLEIKKGHAQSTRPQTLYVPDYGGNSIQGAREDTGSRDGEKTVAEGKGGKTIIVSGQEDWTPFEIWLMAICNKKDLSEQQRANFHRSVRYLDANKEIRQSVSVNEAWDGLFGYQRFVKEVVLLDMEAKHQIHPTGFDNWLNSPKTWSWFHAWRDRQDDDFEEDDDLPTTPRSEPPTTGLPNIGY